MLSKSKILEFKKNLNFILNDKKIVLSCSGGVDSIVLLDLLLKHFKKNLKKVVYVDHGVRPKKEIKKDINCIKYCFKKNRIKDEKIFLVEKICVKKFSEQNLREKRYQKLWSVVETIKNSVLISAHHQNDQFETILLKLTRGAHPETIRILETVREFDKDKILIRPLLNFKKDELYLYAKKENLKWNEDITNQDTKILRNFIRKELEPRFVKLNKNSIEHIVSFFENFIQLRNILNSQNHDQGKQDKIEYLKKSLIEGKKILVKEVSFLSLKKAMDEILKNYGSCTKSSHWENLKKILESRHATKTGGGPKKILQFPGQICLVFESNKLSLQLN